MAKTETEAKMSIVKDVINVAAGLMGILFEKYESTVGKEPAIESSIESSEAADFTQINGIGPTFASRLVEAGITSFAQLAELTPEQAREITHVTVQSDPADWIAEAQALA